MFGISFPEITIILIVAVIALGPEKLPSALVEIAKYFKVIKKSINDAKATFDQEVRIAELKEDAKKYKESISKTTETMRKKLTFEELDEIKSGLNSVKDTLNAGLSDIESSVNTTLNEAENSLNSTQNLAQNSTPNSAQAQAQPEAHPQAQPEAHPQAQNSNPTQNSKE
ncbi:Sec-independent protein translocase protein TatB [Campylobacter sp. JMF_08 NE1]|uniref:Sec-independent protein translocase protein TatB n=1 Tax=Campylobacter sp. JMF_08 NE1 TaxID=2983821 RepID=UPI0022E9CA20|nr:Sec-independent protein translocase protein TatB [Campylobacter sp. JMF_08 NE1]MDA3047627.1 Sec-independent protein translocase protein TatB [Campylobacter sp. JMF_08 NE1]